MEVLTFLELLGCGGHECESQDRMVEPVPSPFISLPVIEKFHISLSHIRKRPQVVKNIERL